MTKNNNVHKLLLGFLAIAILSTGISNNAYAATETVVSSQITSSSTVVIIFTDSVDWIAGDFSTLVLDGSARTIDSVTGTQPSTTATINFSGGTAITTSSTGTVAIATIEDTGSGNDVVAVPTQAITDGQAPVAPSTPDLDTASDLGTSSTDDNTNDNTPTLTIAGVVSGDSIQLEVDGTPSGSPVVATGTSVQLTAGTIGDGTVSITAKSTDPAGNESSASTGLSVTINTDNPTVTSVDMTTTGNAGFARATQTVTITVVDNEVLTISSLTIGGQTASINTNSATTVSMDRVIDGTESQDSAFSITVTDVSGNSSTLTVVSGGGSNVLIDTVLPIVTGSETNITDGGNTNFVTPDAYTESCSATDVTPAIPTCSVQSGSIDTTVIGLQSVIYEATDSAGNVGTDTISTTIVAIVATAPTSLSGPLTTSSENSSVDLTWTAPTSDGGSAITSYRIEYGTSTGVYGTTINTGSATTSATVGSLSENTEYFIIVRAENGAGVNGASNEFSITTSGIPAVMIAPVASVTSTTSTSVAFTLPNANGGTVSAVEIERRLNGGAFASITTTATTSPYLDTSGISPNDDVEYRARATNEFGQQTIFSPISTLVNTSDIVQSAPTLDTVTSSANGNANLSWTAGADSGGTAITGYLIERATDGVTFTTLVANTGDTTTTYTDATATTGITYSYRVSAINGAGTGAASNELSSFVATPVVKKSGGSSASKHLTAPTSGMDWSRTNQMVVDCGFQMNGVCFDVTDNWHTDFEEQRINVGLTNSFSVKTFAQNNGLKVQEIAFGIPEVGQYHNAEVMIEVWYDFNKSIDYQKTRVVQNSGVVNESSLVVTTNQVSCFKDSSTQCYQTNFTIVFDEPLKDKVMAIKAIDMSRRSMSPTYLNEGIDVFGTQLTPATQLQVIGTEKYEGLITVTQTEKYSPLYIAADGRLFEMFGESNSVRWINQVHVLDMDKRSTFEEKYYAELIAKQTFDSSKIQGYLAPSISLYDYVDTVDKRTQFLEDNGLTVFARG